MAKPRTTLNIWPILLLAAAGLAAAWSASHAGGPPDFTQRDAAAMTRASAPQSWQASGDMVLVPAGTYRLGHSAGPADQRPEHTVALAAFRIDRTEVTNAAFAEYLNALSLDLSGSFAAGEIAARHVRGNALDLLREGGEGLGTYPIIALDDDEARIGVRDGRFAAMRGFESHPTAETTWAGARAYCAWRGGRLPTEAEWEAAARGTYGRLYPWGDGPPSDSLVFVSGRTGVTAQVGSRPDGASPFGALDMAGSLAEWTSSLKRPYPYDAADGREAPDAAGERVTRGGDYVFDTEPELLTATHRDGFSNAPGRGHRHIGFRCAISAPQP